MRHKKIFWEDAISLLYLRYKGVPAEEQNKGLSRKSEAHK